MVPSYQFHPWGAGGKCHKKPQKRLYESEIKLLFKSENIEMLWKLPGSKYMPVHPANDILTQIGIDREYVFCAEARAGNG